VTARERMVDARHEQFLDLIAQARSPTTAAREAGCNLHQLYIRRRNDSEFAARWDEAYASGTDVMEDRAVERAMDDSDTLMIFMLKSRDPAKYREKQEPSNVTNVVNFNFTRDPSAFQMPAIDVTPVRVEDAPHRELAEGSRVRALSSIGNDMMSDVSEAASGYGSTIDQREVERRAVADAEEEVRRHNEAVRARKK